MDTAGATATERPARIGVGVWLLRSLAARALLLLALFILLPVLVYSTFSQADKDRQKLVIETIRIKGLTVGRALEERLARADSTPLFRLGEELARYQGDGVALRLLFKPHGSEGFFYVASAPAVGPDDLESERGRLQSVGVLARLGESCAGDLPLFMRVDRSSGSAEVITSITPVRTQRGCWALIVSNELPDAAQQRLGQPYWQAPEVQTAAALYALFAMLVFGMVLDLRSALRRFGRLARAVSEGRDIGRFGDRNPLPDLAPVATAFDGMVDSLRATAAELRQIAEETAHAFKSPLGTIRHALEPLRARSGSADERARLALRAIEASLDRLDGLVKAARTLDAATADRLDPPREPVDLAALVEDVAESYAAVAQARGLRVVTECNDDATALRGGRLIADALAQGIENAVSFSPQRGSIRVRLDREGRFGVITVEDEGPGVAAELLPRIFDRHFSSRPKAGPSEASEPHFGLGLWMARRNVEAIGGGIYAANRPGGGFALAIRVPISR